MALDFLFLYEHVVREYESLLLLKAELEKRGYSVAIHQLLEKVTVISREKIRVTFRDGREIEQYVAQPKRRKLA